MSKKNAFDWKRIKYEYSNSNPNVENDIPMLKVIKITNDDEYKIMGVYFGSQAEEVKELMHDLFSIIKDRDKIIEDDKHTYMQRGFLTGGIVSAAAICGVSFLIKAFRKYH